MNTPVPDRTIVDKTLQERLRHKLAREGLLGRQSARLAVPDLGPDSDLTTRPHPAPGNKHSARAQRHVAGAGSARRGALHERIHDIGPRESNALDRTVLLPVEELWKRLGRTEPPLQERRAQQQREHKARTPRDVWQQRGRQSVQRGLRYWATQPTWKRWGVVAAVGLLAARWLLSAGHASDASAVTRATHPVADLDTARVDARTDAEEPPDTPRRSPTRATFAGAGMSEHGAAKAMDPAEAVGAPAPPPEVAAPAHSTDSAKRQLTRTSKSEAVPPHALQRRAIDAAIEGRYADALKLYDLLIRAQPHAVEYRAARRILLQLTLDGRK